MPVRATHKTIVDVFAGQVQRRPDAVAARFEGEQLTYRELDERSTQLAHHLRTLGVTLGTLVPICIQRSLDMVAGILGILKAGGAYVPIDPQYPRDRVEYMVADTKSTLVISSTQSRPVLDRLNIPVILELDSAWPIIRNEPTSPLETGITPDNLAYVIHTSGSTGWPKGVKIAHYNLVNFVSSVQRELGISDHDRLLALASISFDMTCLDLFLPLLSGATVVVAPPRVMRDGRQLLDLVVAEEITVMQATPVTWRMMLDAGWQAKLPLKILCGGEALPRDLANTLLTRCDELWNMYGPTETTVYSMVDRITPGDTPVTIGRPIDNTQIYLLDESRNLVPTGSIGELCIAGEGVGQGYLNRPDLTDERFIDNPFGTGSKLYRTGDLARQWPDGNMECLGRIDDQVKIRGFRVELGEVESVLRQAPGVKHGVVAAKEDVSGTKRLVGYVVTEGAYDRDTTTRFLETRLPDYMVPRLLMQLTAFPLTNNGKVDRKALPNPDASELLTDAYRAPETRTEEKISAIWRELLKVKRVGIADNFFELGGNSIVAANAVATLNQQYNYNLPITKLYQFPTVGGLAAYLDGRTADRSKTPERKVVQSTTADIAVIGMAGRFPGADTIDELWTVLKEGRETISFFSTDELDARLPQTLVNDPAYVKARGIVRDVEQFDADFFGISPRMAAAMDPQHRIFMEIAWEALEKTGHLPQHYDGLVGVYAGCGNNTYYLNNVLRNQQVLNQVGEFQATTINEKDYFASRTAYQLNLKGPAVSVFSACSSSLLAITQAVDSIRNGQCDVALAGGASVTAPVKSGHLYQEGSMLSQDGHCRSFDAAARGTVFSDGAGVVLLKSLEAARRDGDTVYAVIKGHGVNNDGGGKGSFMAPNAEGQAAAIRMAHATARIDPATISYVETHGTATPVGDPIEIEGLRMAFGDQSVNQFCAIGSIKSNMGHLTAAAGVAGFIKATLALHHRQIPASVGFDTPNPVIDFANSPFFVNTALTDWSATGPRRAGVSSFGVGGTNVHVVLEEAANPAPAVAPDEPLAARPVQLVTWSAKSAISLDAYTRLLTDYLRPAPPVALADVAFTLQTTRADFPRRRFVVASTGTGLIDAAQALTPMVSGTGNRPGEVVFLFPGQGSQYLNMGRELYTHEAAYRQAVDECAELLQAHLDVDIRQVMYPDVANSGAKERLKNTRYTQPALFVTEYALASLWISWGIAPTVFCGHSIGEFVGAHLAGVFTLADALMLIATRGRLVSERPRGSMLSVKMEAAGVMAVLPDNLSIAAVNSPKLCVVAGPDEDVAAFSRLLDERDIPNRVLETSHAFHSAMMDPIVADFENIVQTVTLNRPRKPIVSTVTGTWMTDDHATDSHYWATHLRRTVRFAEAMGTLFEQPDLLLLEVGPGNVTSTLARQHPASRQVPILTSLEVEKGAKTEHQALL
ncbi:MAG: amino acid adenylation domain-containing protein, partial [Bacteroidetes bacterium]|nr:amino acid adenylation domain-containing protein [Fibrella sp.]